MKLQTLNKIEEKLSRMETLDFVKKRLLDIQELPITGVVAGQAVASAVIEYLGMEDQINPIYNDIDVFRPISRSFVKSIVEKRGFLKNQTKKDLVTAKEVEEYLVQNRYGIVFHKTLLKNRMVGALRDGDINTVYIEMEDHAYNISKGDSKVFEVIKNFDINATKVGFDVVESRTLYFTKDFVEFLYSRQLEIVKWQTPTHTLIRLLKKQKEMGVNVYSNNEEAIKLSMLLSDVSRQGKELTDKIESMDLSKDEDLEMRLGYYKTEYLADLPLAFGEKHKLDYEKYVSKEDSLYLSEVMEGKYHTIKTKDKNRGEHFLDELTSFNGAELLKINEMDKCLEKGILGFESTEDLLSFKKNDFVSYEGLLLNLPDLYKSLKNSRRKTVNAVIKDYDQYRENTSVDKDRRVVVFGGHHGTINRLFANHLDIKFFKNVESSTLEDYEKAKKELNFVFKNSHYRLGIHFHAGILFKNIIKMVQNIKQVDKETGTFVGYLETESIHEVDLMNIESCREKMKEYEELMNTPLFSPRVSFETEDYKVVELAKGVDLKGEGVDMDHCVGGYFKAVKNKNSIIIKIVPKNKKGQRATLELNPLKSELRTLVSEYKIGQIQGKKNRPITLTSDLFEVLSKVNESFEFMPLTREDVSKFDYIDDDLFNEFLEYRELNGYGRVIRWLKHARIGKITLKIGMFFALTQNTKDKIGYRMRSLPNHYENPYEVKLAEIDSKKSITYKEFLEEKEKRNAVLIEDTDILLADVECVV